MSGGDARTGAATHGGAPSRIDAATLRAYRETRYRVDADPPFTLRVDVRSDALAALHARRGVAASAFVTACNPHGRLLDAAGNAGRRARLLDELARLGTAHVAGLGRHPSNDWPGEESVLALGLDLDAACALARRHAQNALLWCGADATPALVLLR